jgi:hypothetical protein
MSEARKAKGMRKIPQCFVYLPTYLPSYLPIYLHIYLPTNPMKRFTDLPIYI